MFICQPDFINRSNSEFIGADGIFPRDNSKRRNDGGLVDGKDQLPIRNGAVDDINNSPDTVKPKLSPKTISWHDIYEVETMPADIPVKPLIVRADSDFNAKLFATFILPVMVARSVII